MERKVFTLYELNAQVGQAISEAMPQAYWLEAEISEARVVRGHLFMDLIQKEPFSATPVAKASAKCWHTQWARLQPKFQRVTGETLHAGMRVLLCVRPDFHEAYGFSWIVIDLDPTFTLGDMARKRLEIIAQLKEEGVFDLQQSLPLPSFLQHIAVISSEQAAGYGDFCDQLLHNEYGFYFQTELFPAVMQGEQVEGSVIAALNAINDRLDCFDAVVIIRGGGATADLSGFDTLNLAENVANFPLPIITGIGHERDESVLDMVAHTRVKTPTAAAAFLIDHLQATADYVENLARRLATVVQSRLDYEQRRLDRCTERIPMLFSLVRTQQESRLERMATTLYNKALAVLSAEGHRLDLLHHTLGAAAARQLSDQMLHLSVLLQQLPLLAQHRLMEENHKLEALTLRAKSLDPQLILQRGYSITLHNGKAVRSPGEVSPGDELTTRLEHGEVHSVVK